MGESNVARIGKLVSGAACVMFLLTASAPARAPGRATRPALSPVSLKLVAVMGDPSFRHGGNVTQAVILSDRKRMLTAGNDGTARLWDLTSGKQLQCYRHGGRYVWDVAPLPGDSFSN